MEPCREPLLCETYCKGKAKDDQYSGENAHLPESLLIGIGNPLLDISARVEKDLLEKYNLEPNDAVMAEEKHMPLYKELMENYETEFIAGGSAQNSLRVVQWIVKKPNVCTYFGCIGDDTYGKILQESALSSGVNGCYQITEDTPSGTCAVLVTDLKRSLVANLAAAQKFTIDHLATDKAKKYIDSAKFFYTTGFFIVASPASVLLLAKHANDKGHKFIINLSAPFVMQFFKEQLSEIIPYVDIIIGNEMETEAFAKAFDITSAGLEEIAVKMTQLPQKSGKPPRTVIVTQGAHDVILVEDGKIMLIPVPKLTKEEIVDTNGAGDAFVGGFLSQIIQEKPSKTCIECGIYSAAHILHHAGCTFSGDSQFTPSS